jgi:hypothetical protein
MGKSFPLRSYPRILSLIIFVEHRINPYWKLALVFKCLTDNIMLDDFKSVLQRLGGMKLDGTSLSNDNSLTIESNKSEHMSENSSHRHRLSLSGRMLEKDEVLDDSGRSRRRQSMAASALGSVGVKVRKLNRLPFMQNSAQREARHNMEANKKRASTQTSNENQEARTLEVTSPRHELVSDSREPWEQVDFITALVDPEVEESATRHY